MEPVDRVRLTIDALERELPALDYSAKAVAARLVRLGVLFVEAIQRAAAPFGLSSNEYVILCVLRASGTPHTLPPRAINPLMNLSSGGMTNILHGLESKGLIARLPDTSDRRGVLIRMTPRAKTLIESAIAAHVAEEHRMITALSRQERILLQNLLGKLLVAVDPVRIPMPGVHGTIVERQRPERRQQSADRLSRRRKRRGGK
jgi:DNA-binding MarR family transcriptional regulator